MSIAAEQRSFYMLVKLRRALSGREGLWLDRHLVYSSLVRHFAPMEVAAEIGWLAVHHWLQCFLLAVNFPDSQDYVHILNVFL